MTYPIEIRDRVISHIKDGGSKASASRLYKISHDTIHRWWNNRNDLSPKRKRDFGSWKLNRDELMRLVEDRPDIMLKELSEILGVAINIRLNS